MWILAESVSGGVTQSKCGDPEFGGQVNSSTSALSFARVVELLLRTKSSLPIKVASTRPYLPRTAFDLAVSKATPSISFSRAKTLDIRRGRGEENVDVFGKPHVPVKGNGVPTDNHVVNSVRFE
jgi:hypothetical protein